MNYSVTDLQNIFKQFKLSSISEELPAFLRQAETESWTYVELLSRLAHHESNERERKRIDRYTKWAQFPFYQPLSGFDLDAQESLSEREFKQLSELNWVEQQYNLILLGPPGVGKTALSIGLGLEAIDQGYRVMFVSMGELMNSLKTEEITRKSQIQLKRIREADLVIIDDLMFMALETYEANLFFQLISHLYERASLILTSNKAPEHWGNLIGDEGITTAILDRILHRVEVIHMDGDSYRMKNKQKIFTE